MKHRVETSAAPWGWATPAVRARLRTVPGSLVLSALFALFAYANFEAWRDRGHPSGLGFVVLEGLAAVLFVLRRPPETVSRRPSAWIVAAVGTFAMLGARPHTGDSLAPAVIVESLQLVGLAIAATGLSSLGRSFGIVAANRGLCRGGLYAVVRHPIYAGYLVTFAGYVLQHPSPRNLALVLLTATAQVLRIREEEQELGQDREYAGYRQRVRYRLVPYVY